MTMMRYCSYCDRNTAPAAGGGCSECGNRTVQPIDTSTLGPVRFDPDRNAAAAARVRAAINALRRDDGTDHESEYALALLDMKASDAVLARLERMLRNG